MRCRSQRCLLSSSSDCFISEARLSILARILAPFGGDVARFYPASRPRTSPPRHPKDAYAKIGRNFRSIVKCRVQGVFRYAAVCFSGGPCRPVPGTFWLASASGRLQGCHSAGKALQKAGKFAEAIPYFEQAVDYGEGRFGDGHPKLAKALEWLANAHGQAGNLEKAGPLYKRALEIWQNARGSGHPKVDKILNSLGNLYRKQGRYGEAEKTLKRSLEVLENKLGKDHPQYAKTLDQLGSLYRELGRF